MTEELTTRFSELVRRELGASEVLIADVSDPETEGAIVVALSDGRRIEARFDAPVPDADSLTRRLEILVRAFESVLLEDAPVAKKRAPVAVSLHDELRALAMRCAAVDAIVIDAHSPVIWASATKGTTVEVDHDPDTTMPEEAQAMLRLVRDSHRGALFALGKTDAEAFSVVPVDLDEWEPGPAANEAKLALATRAVEHVRHLPQMPTLHRGGHLAQSGQEEDFYWVARGFAGIYVLVLVFDASPTEPAAEPGAEPPAQIRVERALRDALPRIERLVLALPPLEPDPVPAGAVAFRRRRRG
ncbi:MAG: hypothetical protein HOW73_00245 [Polyangiaceae bacterium]|nr:hypothetical protein [Polyangiaceae bacterium]